MLLALLAIVFHRGDLVEALPQRTAGWRPAYVMSALGPLYRIHYEGLDDRLDETLPPTRLRRRSRLPRLATRPPESTTPPEGTPIRAAAIGRGDRVDVYWGEVWWKAIVTSVGPQGMRIHYDGWPDDDEVIPPAEARRIRPYTPKPKDGPLARGFEALARKDLTTAKERFRHALSQSEGEPDAWLGSARTHLALGENAEALEDARKLVAAFPERADGWLLKGDCHAALKQPREAEAAYAAARSISRSR